MASHSQEHGSSLSGDDAEGDKDLEPIEEPREDRSLSEVLQLREPFKLKDFAVDVAGFLVLFLALYIPMRLTTGEVHSLLKGGAYVPLICLGLLSCRALYQIFGDWLRRKTARFVTWIDTYGFFFVTMGALGSIGILGSVPHAIDGAPFNPLWALGWLVGAVQLLVRRRREAAMRQLRVLGWAAPFVYSLAFAVCSLAFFTYMTMVQHLRFDLIGDARELQAGRVATFYLWHFIAVIPAVDLPETLKWEEPLTYSSHVIGAFVLAFQLTVTLTVLSLVKSFLQSRRTDGSV